MLSWQLRTGPEKAELQELNARLYDYVCRVRELERENLLLEEELRGRRSQEDQWVKGQVRFAEEARALRQQLDELSWATALAEGERDALRRELRELQQLGAEERAARGRLDAELGAQQRELQEALGARAALEALLGRLEAERCGLEEAHERSVRELRARAANLTLHYRARASGLSAPPPRLREVHENYALLVAESWRETVQLYEDEVREMEEALRRGLDSRREAEEETRLCAQEAEALRCEAHEMAQLRARLEDELLRMREAYELQAEERQRVIDCLEDEKAALTMVMTDRLRDYQELVQVKTGLSLEVATYRALLEGESNPEILIWTEHVENIPQEFRNTSYQYSKSILQRENERNLFPRQKVPPVSLNHSTGLYSNLLARPGSQPSRHAGSAAQGSFLGSGYSSLATLRQETAYEKTANSQNSVRTFLPAYGLLRRTEAQGKILPERPQTEGASDTASHIARDSTIAPKSHQERQDNTAVGTSESTWSNERTVTLGKETEMKATREQGRNIPVTIRAKQEEKVFDSKEKASEERNLRWEELTKLDKEARERESQQMKEKAKEKESLKEKSVQEREIPVSLKASQGRTPPVSPKGFQTSIKKDVGGGTDGGVETREMKFRLDTGDTSSSVKGDSMTETIAENIVSSILKQFTQSPDTEASAHSFPDTKVTYLERKELPGDRKTKTEIIVESKLTEDIDVSDEAGLDYLLSQDAQKVELKGKSAERMIGDVINLGLQGREGKAKVVSVEIVEEPMSYVGGEKAEELSTPFEVEEVDDVSPGSREFVEEKEGYGETDSTFSVSQHKRTRQPPENTTHVEEVTEAGDWEGEQSYFVSTPDEHPVGHDKDEGSVYGQIHIEEESTIKYSWQDEIVQGTQRRRKKNDSGEKVVKPLDVPAPSVEEGLDSFHWSDQATSGEFHTGPTVIEKEIKIPHEFHTSMKGVSSKEPKQQLGEVIGQLEESLPKRVREELSVLTREGTGEPGSISVDVKKVQTSGSGSMTLVAEVNLSQSVDADKLDLDKLNRDEASGIERAVESVVRESLTKQQSHVPGSPDREGGTEALATGITFKRWATRELYSPSAEGVDTSPASPSTEQVTRQGPVSATVEVTSPRGFAQSQVLENISQSVRHIQIGPTEIWRTEQVLSEGPTTEVVEVSEEGDRGQAEASAGTSWSVRHVTLGPSQSQMSQEVFFRGPVPALQEEQGAEESGQAEFFRDTDQSGRHVSFDSKQFHAKKEIIFQGPIPAGKVGDSFQSEESLGTQTSVRHLRLDPREECGEQIQSIAHRSEEMGSSVRGASEHTGELPGHRTSTSRIQIGPLKHQTAEHVVYQGPIPQPVGFSDSESIVHREDSADITQATRSYTSGKTVLMTEKSSFQRATSEAPLEGSAGGMSEAEVTSDISRSYRHIRLGPTEAETSEHIIVHGPISKTLPLAGTVSSPEPDKLVDSNSPLRHITLGPKETSFTFQMDVSHVEATPSSAQWTQEATVHFPAGKEVAAPDVSDGGAWKDTGRRKDQAESRSFQASVGDGDQAHGPKGKEHVEFDKTVQLQRMVDQRSVVSDEKKVALLYLDNEEEEDGHWF